MSSNNPFASALNEPDSYVHHREPPPPPSSQIQQTIPLNQARSAPKPQTSSKLAPPPRPPKGDLPPPSYEEAAGRENAQRDYPREKTESSSDLHDRSHRDRSQRDRSDRERSGRPRRDREGEHHHRERRSHSESDHRKHRERSSRLNKKSPKKEIKVTKAKNLDTIDKLDVTAFFGGGFHHDGPFDACTPHRNKNAKQAPVMAFPVDGPNSTITGLQNIDKTQQMNLAFGNYEEDAQNEIVGRKASVKYGKTNRAQSVDGGYAAPKTGIEATDVDAPRLTPGVIAFDVNTKSTPVHGSTTAGLGSSTFIDGAPAPKAVSYESDEPVKFSGDGLGRKKSIVQRLRKNSGSEENSRRNSNEGIDNRRTVKDDETIGNSFIRRVKSLKVRR